MFNDHLSREEAKELIKQRIHEVEIYSLQKRLGFGDSGAARWIFGLIITLMAVLAVGLLF